MVFCIGVIGNIASGKSTVISFFKDFNIEIINADLISRDLTKKDSECYKAIVSHFGTSIQQEGVLDRGLLKKLIFKDPEERIWLENLLHPKIRAKIKDKVLNSLSPYCLVEIPLLPNLKNYPYIKRILWIKASTKDQIQRIVARDSCSEKDAYDILFTQAKTYQYEAIANDILENHGTLEQLENQIKKLHQKYLDLAMQE